MLEHDKRARLNNLRGYHATMRRRRRRQIAASWYSEGGEELLSPAAIGQAFGVYWGAVYKDIDIDSECAADFLRSVQVWDGGGWVWERGHTQSIAVAFRESSPGQDGLSYAFWAGAPAGAHALLDDIAEKAQGGGRMPPQFTASVTVTQPKADILVDRTVQCSDGAASRTDADGVQVAGVAREPASERGRREDRRTFTAGLRAREADRGVYFGLRRRMHSGEPPRRASRGGHSFRPHASLSVARSGVDPHGHGRHGHERGVDEH